MGRLNTARAAALWERGSRTEVANASWSDGENSSLAPCVITKRMPTLTALPTSITRFIASGIGSRAKNRRPHRRRRRARWWWHARPLRLQVVGEKPGEGNPADPGQARMQMSIHVKVVGLALVQRGHVPV